MIFNDYNKFVFKQYLLSPEWKILESKALNRANYRCEKCGSENNFKCHHKSFKNLYKETFDDLIVLCDRCKKR